MTHGLVVIINCRSRSSMTIACFFVHSCIWPNSGVKIVFSCPMKLYLGRGNLCLYYKRFEGMMVPSKGQAALLTFCTCISLASVALVLSIAIPEGGNNWFWLMLLSPLAGAYYWKRASRKEEIKVKMMVAEDGNISEIVVRGDDEQVEQMRKELKLSEKGMIYVKGIFET